MTIIGSRIRMMQVALAGKETGYAETIFGACKAELVMKTGEQKDLFRWIKPSRLTAMEGANLGANRKVFKYKLKECWS